MELIVEFFFLLRFYFDTHSMLTGEDEKAFKENVQSCIAPEVWLFSPSLALLLTFVFVIIIIAIIFSANYWEMQNKPSWKRKLRSLDPIWFCFIYCDETAQQWSWEMLLTIRVASWRVWGNFASRKIKIIKKYRTWNLNSGFDISQKRVRVITQTSSTIKWHWSLNS